MSSDSTRAIETTHGPSALTASTVRTWGLIALFVAAQAAALRLIEVRPYAVFQHYLSWTAMGAGDWTVVVALATLAAQTLICLAFGWRPLLMAVQGVWDLLGPIRLVVGLGVLAFSTVIPAESVFRFGGEVLVAGWIAGSALLNLVLVGDALPRDGLRRAGAWVSGRVTLGRADAEPRPWDRALPWALALWVTAVCAAVAWFVFEGVPHIDDSIAYLFQAKYYLRGALFVPSTVDSASFPGSHFIDNGTHLYGKFFPGWPVLLAVGVLAGAPWLVNPILGGAAIVLAHALVRRLYDRGTANATALLLAFSPWLIFNSSEMMSHAACLVWTLLAFLAIDLQRERRVGLWALLAGLSLGALFLTRPFDAMLIGPVAALWGWGVAGKRLSLASLAVIAVVAAGSAGLLFLYNGAVTGDPATPPHELWAEALWGPGIDVMGFGKDVGIPLWRNVDPLPGHGLADVILNTNKNLTLLNFELFAWACGSLVLAVLAALMASRRNWTQGDTVMAGIVVAVIGGHAAYWTPGGPDFGPRYWYLTIVPLVVLSVRGAQMLAASPQGARLPDLGPRLAAVILVATATAFICVTPWRSVTKYHRYRDVGGDIRALTTDTRFAHALVFVRSDTRADYQSAMNFNSPWFDGPGPVFAFDAGPEHREAVVRRYPDRPIWIVGKAPGEVHRRVILAGPLPAGRNPPGEAYDYQPELMALVGAAAPRAAPQK
jgi:4-amino-4-deoxy-L-arabinose transferase-like glycosyltransferase